MQAPDQVPTSRISVPTAHLIEMQPDVEHRLRAFLSWIVDRPLDHAKWLNTLSLLEHIGARKIIKAMDSTTLDETMLRHIAEEARHAHVFKRLSARIMPEACPDYTETCLFCGSASKNYFQSLDHDVHAYLLAHGHDNSRLNYLCVTTLIEIRATQLYATYENILRAQHSVISLKSVLAEEDRHLQEMRHAFEAQHFSWSLHATSLFNIELPLFNTWLRSLEHQQNAT